MPPKPSVNPPAKPSVNPPAKSVAKPPAKPADKSGRGAGSGGVAAQPVARPAARPAARPVAGGGVGDIMMAHFNNEQEKVEFNGRIDAFRQQIRAAGAEFENNLDELTQRLEEITQGLGVVEATIRQAQYTPMDDRVRDGIVRDLGEIYKEFKTEEQRVQTQIATTGPVPVAALAMANPNEPVLSGRRIQELKEATDTWNRSMQSKIQHLPTDPDDISRLQELTFGDHGLIVCFHGMLDERRPGTNFSELIKSDKGIALAVCALAQIGPFLLVQGKALDKTMEGYIMTDESPELTLLRESVVSSVVFTVFPISESLSVILSRLDYKEPGFWIKITGGIIGVQMAFDNYTVFQQVFYLSSAGLALMRSFASEMLVNYPYSCACFAVMLKEHGNDVSDMVRNWFGWAPDTSMSKLFDRIAENERSPPIELDWSSWRGICWTLPTRLINSAISTVTSTAHHVVRTVSSVSRAPREASVAIRDMKMDIAISLQFKAYAMGQRQGGAIVHHLSLLECFRADFMRRCELEEVDPETRERLDAISEHLGLLVPAITIPKVAAQEAQALLKGSPPLKSPDQDRMAVYPGASEESLALVEEVMRMPDQGYVDGSTVVFLPNGDSIMLEAGSQTPSGTYDEAGDLSSFMADAAAAAPADTAADTAAAAADAADHDMGGGRSRSRKRSVSKRTARRKAATKKQKSKKNKRQSRRKVRRSSSRRSRK